MLHPIHGDGLDTALARVDGIELLTPSDDEEVGDALESVAQVLVTFRWDDRFMVPNLRWIQSISTGVDQFPLDELARHRVVLTSALGAHAPAVADHALALFLALVRGIGRAARGAPARRWVPSPAVEVAGLTVVVLGMGEIGRRIAERLGALSTDVIGVRLHPDRSTDGHVVGPDRLLWACRQADAMICALPAGADTEKLIGPAELAALGKGWLVNVGRGSVVDEEALVSALVEKRLLGAALDVTTVEPLPLESPLWDLENVIVTPHMGWVSDRLTPRLAAIVEQNLTAFRGERPWLNRVV